MQGRVKWFNQVKGYGFIASNNGEKDLFVHYTGIAGSKKDRRNLEENQVVEFDVAESDKGPKAVNVQVVGQ